MDPDSDLVEKKKPGSGSRLLQEVGSGSGGYHMGSATLVSSPKISSSLTKVVTAGLYQNEPSTKQNREIKIEMMMMVEMEPVRTGLFHLVPTAFLR